MDEATVAAIVSIPDPVARNRAITRGYHDLASLVGDVIGRENANWLCFGQWASAEAGRAIRGESVPALVRPLIGDSVTAAVAAGNAAVFADVAPPFIRFVRVFSGGSDGGSDARDAAGWLAQLLDHPQVSASADLQRAFRAYADAITLRSEAEAEASRLVAQRILVANASVGAHEQVVADPHIRAAIPGESIFAIAATAHLGVRIPDGDLALNRDVPRPTYLAGAAFPPDLARLEDPEAVELAQRFGQALDSSVHSDAPNWESYDERMGYIFCLLRAFQQDPAMFELPLESRAVEPPPPIAGAELRVQG